MSSGEDRCTCGHRRDSHVAETGPCLVACGCANFSDVAPEFVVDEEAVKAYVPPTPRLMRLSDDLWVDPDEIVSVSTERQNGSRWVLITLRTGVVHRLMASSNYRTTTTSESLDQSLRDWLRDHFSGLLRDLDD